MDYFRLKKWFSREMGIRVWLGLFLLGLFIFSLGLAILAVHLYKTYHFPARIGYLTYYLSGQSISRVWRGLLLLSVSLTLIVVSYWRIRQKIIKPLLGYHGSLADLIYQQRSGRLGPRIVVIGGGTGLSTLLRGLKKYTSNITAIVAMTDDGKSTGRLRADFGTLPPGDIRHCITALASDESILRELFEYRFSRGGGLAGHSFGNLFIVALSDIVGGFDRAVVESGRILSIKGRVLPSTLHSIQLGAEFGNGKKTLGESSFTSFSRSTSIKRIFLRPAKINANREALKAIGAADLIVIGPGSLYTSVLPNFLVPGITTAVLYSSAKKVYVCNVSTERGETQHMSAIDHLRTLIKYTSPKIVNYALVNNRIIKHSSQEGRLGNIHNITTNKRNYHGIIIRRANVINTKAPLYHDSDKLAKALIKLSPNKS